jgi:hypothetical protein
VLGFKPGATVGLLLATGGFAEAFAQAGIYTCTDAKGRRITSDRPIVECLDREQKELTPAGTVKRTLRPTLTPEEAAVEHEKQRKAAEEVARQAEEKKRERALLSRYPHRASHDTERSKALVAVDQVIATAQKRIAELETARKRLAEEAEFYKADPSKIPPKLKREIELNEQDQAAQKRFIANQNQEKQRVNNRFDEELARLQQIWAAVPRTAAGPAPSAKAQAQSDRR